MFVDILWIYLLLFFFFFQAEDGIRDLVRSRGLGDVYKRQLYLNGIYNSDTRSSTPTANSRVGIGTATPAYKLQVMGDVGVSTSLTVGGTVTLTGLPLGTGTTILYICLLYTSPSPRDRTRSRMPSSA